MPTIKIVNKHEELSHLGCQFFTQASECHKTRITSAKLRWLSVRKGKNNDEYISDMQKEACNYIDDISQKYGSNDWNKLNLKILLYDNPIKSQDETIKKLLKCGAEVKYLKSKDCSKIVIQDNILFLSFATSFDKVVNSGIYYVGKESTDPFIEYYLKLFDSQFQKARKISLKDDKIEYDDGFFTLLWKTLIGMEMKEWVNALVGAILGIILTIIVL